MTVEPVPDPQPRQHAPGRGAVPKPRLRGKSRHDVAAPPGGFTKILVTDFNQTIARDGRVDGATVAALRWLRDEAGFALILATGETMYHLKGGAGFIAFPELGDIFHAVICDNGGAVGNPATGKSRRLGKKPPPAFLRRLDIVASPGNLPYYTGKTSVSLHREHHDTAASVIAAGSA